MSIENARNTPMFSLRGTVARLADERHCSFAGDDNESR